MKLDLLIEGGTVHDGSGAPLRTMDLGIADGRIAAMGNLAGAAAAEKRDAARQIICPGFIDTHAHSEFTLLADPRAEGKIRQGVTTEINGNCGLSAGPMLGACAERREADLREFDIPERWQALEEYFGILAARRPTLNVATLVGHGNLRASVMGYADRPADADEIAAMRSLLAREMTSGALGVSTGLIYPPGLFTKTDELVELVEAAVPRRGLYATHMRSEGDELLESVQESLEIGRRAGIPVHLSHLKTNGRSNWGKIDAVLEKIRDARQAGIRVTADRYPYTASSTDLDTILPGWVFEGGHDAERRRLENPRTLARIRKTLDGDAAEPGFWEGIRVSAVQNDALRWMEGRDLASIAHRNGTGPFETLIDILRRDRLRTSAIFFGMSEENLIRVLKQGYTMVGSDAAARCFDGPTFTGRPHPRAFGSFPRFLSKYVMDGVMPLTEGLYRLTGLPAEVFGLRDRGVIRPGAAADIVIFDPEAISDEADFDRPFSKPAGIEDVWVNGVAVLRRGEMTGRRPGRILRRNDGS